MVAGNPQRTSWTPEEVTDDLQIEWYRPIEAYIPQHFQVIAANGLIYISTADGLYALNAVDGSEAWRFETDMPLGHSPTVVDGVVYVGGYDRKLHALDALTGNQYWAFDGAGAGYETNPLVVDGKVILGNRDGNMYAIGAHGTPEQGQELWHFETDGPIHISAAYQNGVVYFAAGDNFAYALNADNGNLIWKSAQLPGMQYQSYWPVIYRDKVIFVGAPGYRTTRPGLGSIIDLNGARYNKYHNVERDDLLGNAPDGTLIGPSVPGQDWSHGRTVLDGSRITEYHESKPWRRIYAVLNQNDGSEYTFDSDGDGLAEYIPVAFWGAQSGNAYPPIIGSDDILYASNIYQKYFIPQGKVTGWKMDTPYLSIMGGQEAQGAVDEPQAISMGGETIYRSLCCDRVGDYWGLAGGYEVLWTYGDPLSEQAPGYDPTWVILPGHPRLRGWYQGVIQSVNAAYHNHGVQNPIVPYQGRLYVHRSNAIIAYGPGTGPNHVPMLQSGTPTSYAEPIPHQEVRNRLENEVQKMIDAGHLRPGYYQVSQFWIGGLDNYFVNPGDTIYTLSIAYPYLSPDLKTQVRNYLQNEFQTYFDPVMYARTGWDTGAPRELMSFPPEAQADLADLPPSTNAGNGFAWSYPQHNFYAMWKYAEVFPADAVHIYDLAKSKLEVPVAEEATNQYFLEQPYELNGWISGYIGFLGLQEFAGMSGTDAQLRASVNTELNRLLQLKITQFTKDSYWYSDEFFRKHLDLATNFIYLTPELGDFMQQHLSAQVAAAIDEYETIGAYWFVSRFDNVVGEGTMSNLYNYNAVFQAKALIQHQSSADLTPYLDAPAFYVGDLHYIQNLVAVLATAPGAPTKEVQPSYGSQGDSVTYTLQFAGTGNSMTMTDELPTGVSAPTDFEIEGADTMPVYDAGQHAITWADTPAEFQEVTINYEVTISTDETLLLENLATWLDSEGREDQATAVLITNPRQLFLSIVFR
jgi:hypothetical protein